MTFYAGSLVGFFLGFTFGVGCALAVLYSIFLGGYRAAVRDSSMVTPPDRLRKLRARFPPAAHTP